MRKCVMAAEPVGSAAITAEAFAARIGEDVSGQPCALS